MKNVIKLDAPEYLSAIAGECLAESICKKQVLLFVESNAMNTIIFPEHIKMSTQSFIEHFIYYLKKGTQTDTRFEFKASSKRLEDKLNKTLEGWEDKREESIYMIDVIEKGKDAKTKEEIVKLIIKIYFDNDIVIDELLETIELKDFSIIETVSIYAQVIRKIEGDILKVEKEGETFIIE